MTTEELPIYTCYYCPEVEICKYAYSEENTNGECIVEIKDITTPEVESKEEEYWEEYYNE